MTVDAQKQQIPTRQRVLAYIGDYINRNGYGPSLRDIGRGVGLRSIASVEWHLHVLAADGLITRAAGIPRSIRLVEVAA